MNELAETIQYNNKEVLVSGDIIFYDGKTRYTSYGINEISASANFTRNLTLKDIFCKYISNISSPINDSQNHPAELLRTLCKANKGFEQFIKFEKQTIVYDYSSQKRKTHKLINVKIIKNIPEIELRKTKKNYIIIKYAKVNESFINYFVWFKDKLFKETGNFKLIIKKRKFLNLFAYPYRNNNFDELIDEMREWFKHSSNNGPKTISEYSEAKQKNC